MRLPRVALVVLLLAAAFPAPALVFAQAGTRPQRMNDATRRSAPPRTTTTFCVGATLYRGASVARSPGSKSKRSASACFSVCSV